MDKRTSAVTVHLSEDRKRQFAALARCEGLGRHLVEDYIERKRAELSILQDVFDVEGTGGNVGTDSNLQAKADG